MNKQNLDNLIDGKNSVDKVSENTDRDVLMKRMFKLMMESMMEAERTIFLGYDKHDFAGYGSGNSRNGTYERELLTTMGNLDDLKIPRDRLGDFSSELLDKYERATKPMDKMVLALYAKGMSTRDIGDLVNELYGRPLSPQAVTNVTGAVIEQREAWEKRAVAKRYVAIFIDALVVKIRRDTVDNDAVYVVAGIDELGYRDVLGLYYGTSESATHWEEVLEDIKKRGVEEVLVFVMDGLTGLPDAVARVFPKAFIQGCVVHQIRATLSHVRAHHKQAVADDLRSIYSAESYEQAKERLEKVKENWVKIYPRLFTTWEEKLKYFMTFLEFPKGIRKFMYTTNWIERLNKEFRKVLKNKNSMPTEDSVRNLLYLKVKDLTFKWQGQKLQGFSMYSAELNEIWDKRYPSQERGFTQNT
jgi:putative transposase